MRDDGEALDEEGAKGGATRPADPARKGRPIQREEGRAEGEGIGKASGFFFFFLRIRKGVWYAVRPRAESRLGL